MDCSYLRGGVRAIPVRGSGKSLGRAPQSCVIHGRGLRPMNRAKRHRRDASADLLQNADALLYGESGGWVWIAANAKGRCCVEQVFPKADITWHASGEGFSPDWQWFRLNVPDAAALRAPNNLLPSSIPLDEARSDMLAFFMAAATMV